MAVIETRYLDIPFDEATQCQPRRYSKTARETWERKRRGKPVRIIVPASGNPSESIKCTGPFYLIASGSSYHEEDIVCPHIAEIGD